MAQPIKRKSKRTFRQKLWRNSKKAINSTQGQLFVHALTGAALIALKGKLGLNTETKYVDTATATYTPTSTIATAMSNASLTLIPQGLTSSTRTGASIRMTRYEVRGTIYNPPGNLTTSTMRVLIVNWGRTPFASTSASSVLQQGSDIESMRNLDPPQPFRILSDRRYRFFPNTMGDNRAMRSFNFVYAPKNHHITWTDADTTGSTANLLKGYIAIYFFVDTYTAASQPYLQASQRVFFVDN